MFNGLPRSYKTSLRTARLTKIGIKVIWIQTRRTASGGFPNSCNLGTNTVNKSCQVTDRHIEKAKGRIVGYAGAIVENVEKEKESNLEPLLPKSKRSTINAGLKGCPLKGSRLKVGNDQSECIVEILTEHITKKGIDKDKRRKKVNILTSR